MCLLVGGALFRPLAIRRNVSPDRRGRDTPSSQKAPSAKRCIKTPQATRHAHRPQNRQKAPSAKRCIKTCPRRRIELSCRWFVRKHRAPNGALGLTLRLRHQKLCSFVRKHRAPNGALRLVLVQVEYARDHPRQKAPSAKRRIKTLVCEEVCVAFHRDARKHRAPNGALRLIEATDSRFDDLTS